jgi:hypothetical protein
MRIRPARVSDLDEVASIRQAAIARHAPATYSKLEVAQLRGWLARIVCPEG